MLSTKQKNVWSFSSLDNAEADTTGVVLSLGAAWPPLPAKSSLISGTFGSELAAWGVTTLLEEAGYSDTGIALESASVQQEEVSVLSATVNVVEANIAVGIEAPDATKTTATEKPLTSDNPVRAGLFEKISEKPVVTPNQAVKVLPDLKKIAEVDVLTKTKPLDGFPPLAKEDILPTYGELDALREEWLSAFNAGDFAAMALFKSRYPVEAAEWGEELSPFCAEPLPSESTVDISRVQIPELVACLFG